MKDFTLKKYKQFLKNIVNSYDNVLRFDDFFIRQNALNEFVIIRHDVDRKPLNALKTAKIENELGIQTTYYFRSKNNKFSTEVIKEISSLGHEIGYHYENLSDENGDMESALLSFEENLNKLRGIVPVKTIAMHGKPFSKYDNRDLWKNKENHDLLLNKFEILGEVYLDIDYTNIAYINDTGRNWSSGRSNLRDKVNSQINTDFKNNKQVLAYLQNKVSPKVIFQMHPERWSDNLPEWTSQLVKDKAINSVKLITSIIR
ncbi:MAG: hypothetical protein WCK67_03905 [bacterium]